MLDPGADVGFEVLDVPVGSTSDLLVGQESKPSLDLVDPGGTGGREMHMESGVAFQPCPNRGCLVSTVVVADKMNLQMTRQSD